VSNEEHLNSLHAQNEELEMEIQIQCEEKEILQKHIESMKKILNQFETICSGRASDPMVATIKKWRTLKKKIAKENIV
jgi:hypothetical protein